MAGKSHGSMSITNITGETEDISEHLDFSFYDKVLHKDKAALAPEKSCRWLGVSSRTSRLMTYCILALKGTAGSCAAVQRVPYLELQLDEVK